MREFFLLDGVGSDVFGEEATGRNAPYDPVNEHLRTKALAEWFKHAMRNGQLRDDFQADLTAMRY